MTVWICATCGIEHADSDLPPDSCRICDDERQWVPADGQQWTTAAELATGHRGGFSTLEEDLVAVTVTPSVGIGQRGLLLRTPAGNLLWEPPGFLDAAMIDRVRDLGGVAAVAASHPHLVGAAVSWSQAFGGVPFYFNRADARWLRRPDPAVVFWDAEQEVLPGVRLIRCGGHFPGSAVAHWAAGAGGKGVLLTGDTIFVNAHRPIVSFMRSYPNLLPLSERLVRRIAAAVAPLTFDRLYGGFDGLLLADGAQHIVAASAERYIGWLTDAIRDPDEPSVVG